MQRHTSILTTTITMPVHSSAPPSPTCCFLDFCHQVLMALLISNCRCCH